MLKMRRIPAPEWAKPFAVTVDGGFGDQEFNRFSTHREEVREIIQDAVEQYINDDKVVSVGEQHFFPELKRLTGDYYIASEDYYVHQEQDPRHSAQRQLVLSVTVRCLEKPWIENQTDFDYLGLELFFLWEPKQQTLSYTGDIEPSSI